MTRLKKQKYKEGEEVVYIGGQMFNGGHIGQRAIIKMINGKSVHLSFIGQMDYGLYWSCETEHIQPIVLDWDQ